MTWICFDCSTIYSVGAPACPHCGSIDYVEEGDVAKITKHGGATNAAAEVVAVVVAAAAESEHPGYGEVGEGVEVPADGTEHELIVEVPDEVVEFVSEEFVDVPVAPRTPYDTWLLADLQEELSGRGLPKTGNKADLVQRLIDDDTAKLAEFGDDPEF